MTEIAEKPQYSNVLPLWKLWLLSFATFRFYHVYWLYKNWRQLEQSAFPGRIQAGIWTICLLVPVWNVILIAQQFQYIKTFAQDNNVPTYKHPIVMALIYVLFILLFGLLDIWVFNDDPALSLTILFLEILCSTAVLAFIQHHFNALWGQLSPELPTRHKLNGYEIALTVIGAIFWGGNLLGWILWLTV